MQQVLAAHGARVAVVGSPVGKCALDDDSEYRQHLEWFDRMCVLAHRFGTRVIRGFAFWAPSGSERDRPDLSRYLDRIAARLAPIAERAEAEDVLYCFETEGSTMTGTCAEIAAVIEALGESAHLGATWDVNNGWDCGELPLPDGYAHIRGRVHHVHVKPNAQKSIETVADSPVTYAQVVRALRDDGYAGYLGVEHWGSSALMLEGVRQVKALLS
jgi:sugar phosphate isomerase/epimerase